jgi:hypothetical protein
MISNACFKHYEQSRIAGPRRFSFYQNSVFSASSSIIAPENLVRVVVVDRRSPVGSDEESLQVRNHITRDSSAAFLGGFCDRATDMLSRKCATISFLELQAEVIKLILL